MRKNTCEICNSFAGQLNDIARRKRRLKPKFSADAAKLSEEYQKIYAEKTEHERKCVSSKRGEITFLRN